MRFQPAINTCLPLKFLVLLFLIRSKPTISPTTTTKTLQPKTPDPRTPTSPTPLARMSRSPAPAEPKFLNLTHDCIAGLPRSKCSPIELMMHEVRSFDPHAPGKPNGDMSVRQNAVYKLTQLFATHPFLGFTLSAPGIGNAGSRLESRLAVWADAHAQAGSSFSPDEASFAAACTRFMADYASGAYPFLPPQPRALTTHDRCLLRLHALGQLALWIDQEWAPLSPDQRLDRRILRRWIEDQHQGLQLRGYHSEML